jgi:hypothetical protein
MILVNKQQFILFYKQEKQAKRFSNKRTKNKKEEKPEVTQHKRKIAGTT